jgi:serine/threonine protein kinase
MTKAVEWSDLELVNMLGEGQAGRVWLAKLKRQFKDFPVGSLVAVKTYKSWVLEQPGQFERIVRELELGRRITHPNLVKTLSIIRDVEGKPALVMDFYDGNTLESYLEERRRQNIPIDLGFAFKIIGDLASVINALHQAGAIHRDVKPANIILSGDKPILMDLGVISSKDFPEQTTSGAFLGTIRYAAPEYLFGEEYDSRIDIYSLGAIAYELFNRELFLSMESQWARLIVAKTVDYYGGFEDFRELKNRFGMNIGVFIGFILKYALAEAESRTLNLSELIDLIEKRVWEKLTYTDHDKLVEGEPKVHYLGDWKEDAPVANLSVVVDDLNKRLSLEERVYLYRSIDRDYWHLPITYLSSMSDIEKRLQAVGATGYGGHGVNPEDYFYHEAVIAAYRNDYSLDNLFRWTRA